MANIRVFTFSVNNAGNREAIQVSDYCSKFEIMEDPSVANWPTQDYKISDVATGGTAVQRSAGTPFFFDRKLGKQYSPNETIAYIETLSGVTTFQRIEYID